MLVLGLDPGVRHTGYGLVTAGREPGWVAHGRFSPPTQLPLAERLAHLVEALDQLLISQGPAVAAVERPFHGVNAHSLVVLAEARGALLATLGRRGIAVREFTPAEVKSSVAGSGRAAKADLARMVALLLRRDLGRIPADASDALALALCYSQHARMDRLSARLAGSSQAAVRR